MSASVSLKSTNANVSLLLELLLKECIELVESSSIMRTIYLCALLRTLSGLYVITGTYLRYLMPKLFYVFWTVHHLDSWIKTEQLDVICFLLFHYLLLNRLRIFERKILRKIFGPVQDKNGIWRIRKNHELNELIGNADIVRFIRSRRMAWLGHVMRMEGGWIPTRILEWKPMVTTIRDRPRKRWIEYVEEDIQMMEIRGWRKLSKKRMEWKNITEKAKTHSGL